MKEGYVSNDIQPGKKSRRSFLKLAAGVGGVSLFGSFVPTKLALSAGKTEALVLSCMDFRLMDEIEGYCTGRGLRDKYDHIVLAGASLGAVTDKYPAWNKTFWEHLDIAIKLHNIHKVIIIDHRDCGAYKVILGEDFAKDPAKETKVHAEQLKKLAKMIKEKYNQLEVETTLMSLDGSVETIS